MVFGLYPGLRSFVACPGLGCSGLSALIVLEPVAWNFHHFFVAAESTLPGTIFSRYIVCVSTVTEIKAAVQRLPDRQKRNLAKWLQSQVDDRFSDDEMMAIAAEGARALDLREEEDAKRKSR
jgi:hypothetical protein